MSIEGLFERISKLEKDLSDLDLWVREQTAKLAKTDIKVNKLIDILFGEVKKR